MGVGVRVPDVKQCAERAAVAMRYLAEHYSEWFGFKALHPLQEAAHEVDVSGSWDDYLEILREYCRTGRAVAFEIRKGVA